jgi:hypothetical protein
MVCIPKKQGGLGVLDLNMHNDAMLLKYLHKFFSKADIPWVKLVWNFYYSNGKLHGQSDTGSFWWWDIVKLLDKFKGMASVRVGDGSTIIFWQDRWNGMIPAQSFPELFIPLPLTKESHSREQLTIMNSSRTSFFHSPHKHFSS